jgi:serine/threonine protein kinase
VPIARGQPLLVSGQAVESPETGLRYRIERLLGEGGFGQAYLATRIGKSADVPSTVCIKVSPRMDGWIREAYFGQLLDGHPRAIRVFDRFPLMRADGQVRSSTACRPSKPPSSCAAVPTPSRRRGRRAG